MGTFEILSQSGMGEIGFSLPRLQLKSAWEKSHSSRKKHNHAKVWFGAIADNKCQNAAPSPSLSGEDGRGKMSSSVVSPLERSKTSQAGGGGTDMKLRLPLQPHICMKDCKLDMGKDRGKLFRLSLGVGAKLEFTQSKLR